MRLGLRKKSVFHHNGARNSFKGTGSNVQNMAETKAEDSICIISVGSNCDKNHSFLDALLHACF